MNGFLYLIYLGFFLSHIPITLFVDSQAGERTHRHSLQTDPASIVGALQWQLATPPAACHCRQTCCRSGDAGALGCF